jgi:putative nucleotidyltransferase with HDIG domain
MMGLMNWITIQAQEGVSFPAEIPPKYVDTLNKLQGVAAKHGYKIYATGGFVRDALLGRESKDLDVMVEGAGAGVEFANLVAQELGAKVSQVYGRVGTAKVILDDNEIEFAMARKESYPDESSRTPVVEAATPEEDALRRDFGMNSLFIRLEDMKLLDLTGHGVKDIEDKVVRMADPGDPDRAFHEDPLRMLRAVRQSLQLGFEIEPEVLAAIKRNAPRLETIVAERTRDELAKMIVAEHPSRGVRMLVDLDLIDHVAPEIKALVGVEQTSKYHGEDVFEHTMMVLDELKDSDEVTRLAALLHDVGKPASKTIADDIAHFFGHEDVGAEMARDVLRRLKFPEDTIKQVSSLIQGHMRPHLYKKEWGDKAIRRTIRDLGPLLDKSLALAEADVRGTTAEEADKERRTGDIAELRERIRKEKEGRPIDPGTGERVPLPELFSGNELMDMAGRGPGPWIRQMKEFLKDKQDENPALTREEATPMVQTYLQEHSEELKASSTALSGPLYWVTAS